MSEKLCTLRTQGGGGGKQTETVLWTNSSPSSNFASQTITLSDNMTNYKYLKVTYINATGSSVSNVDIVPVSAFITTGTQTIRSALGAVGTTGGSTRDFARNYKYVADNQINFGTASALNYAAAENNRIIPLEILGLNELDHGKRFDETVLWTNSAPTSSFAKQDVTLSDDINSYDYLKFTYRVTTSVADFLNYIISVSDFKKSVETTGYHHCVLGLSTDDSTAHTRRVYYKNDTTVNFYNAYQLNAVASNNATVIPTSIVGCKFR